MTVAPQFLKHRSHAEARLTVEEQDALADCANLAIVLGCATRAFAGTEEEPSRKERDAIATLATKLGEDLHRLAETLSA